MQLLVVTPPDTEPVTVEQFFADRRIVEWTTAEEDAAAEAIMAARGHVEAYTRRALIRQRLRLTTSGRWVATPLRLLRPPVIEVATVTVDGSLLEASDYELDDAGLWPRTNGSNSYPQQWLTAYAPATRVVVDYWAGYGWDAEDVPADLRRAVMRIAGDLFEHREDAVVGHAVGEVSVTAQRLMDPYRVRLC